MLKRRRLHSIDFRERTHESYANARPGPAKVKIGFWEGEGAFCRLLDPVQSRKTDVHYDQIRSEFPNSTQGLHSICATRETTRASGLCCTADSTKSRQASSSSTTTRTIPVYIKFTLELVASAA